MTLTVNFVITAFAFIAIVVLFFTTTGIAGGESVLRHSELLTDLPYGWICVLASLQFGMWYTSASKAPARRRRKYARPAARFRLTRWAA